jgi:thiol-disulfide isomerase/thioredoxin
MNDNYRNKYLKYKEKYLNLKNIQSGGKNTENKHTLYLFKADWCGHCNAFKNNWEELKKDKELSNKINFITVDSNDKSKINQWKISGYPTIIFHKNESDAIEYNDNRDVNSIKKFINSHI